MSPLQRRIEVDRGSQSAEGLNSYASAIERGIDPTVMEHIEELLEEIELAEQRAYPPQANEEDFTSVFKKVADIERRLKQFEAESIALKKLLQRLN
jgi:hypothetical protein